MIYVFIGAIGFPVLAFLLFYLVVRHGNAVEEDGRGTKGESESGKGKSVQQFLDFARFVDVGCETKSDTLAIFEIYPNNLSVLPEHVIAEQVWHLQMLLQQMGDMEILCTDGINTGEENRSFLRRRIAEEENERVRELLEKDLEAFENTHLAKASIRQFFLILRMEKAAPAKHYRLIDDVARAVREHGLNVRLLTPAEIRHMLGIYYIGYQYAEKWKEEDFFDTKRETDPAQASEGAAAERAPIPKDLQECCEERAAGE